MSERGLTVDELARLSGVSARMIMRYRKGQTSPVLPDGRPSLNARLIALAMAMDPEDLLWEKVEA